MGGPQGGMGGLRHAPKPAPAGALLRRGVGAATCRPGDSAMMIAGPLHPPFLFCLAKRETGRTRKGYAASVRRRSRRRLRDCAVQREKRFAALRCSGPPRGRGSPESVPAKPPAFCRLAPDRSFSPALTRVFGAAVVWVENPHGPLLLSPLPLHGPARGLSNGRTRRSAPTEGKSLPAFCRGRPMCRPLSRCREGGPTFPRRRQEVCAGADRPAEHIFFSTGRSAFSF